MFGKMLYDKLVEESRKWRREEEENDHVVAVKKLVFCWKRYESRKPEDLFKEPRVVIGTLVHRGIEYYFGQPDSPENVIRKEIEVDGETWTVAGIPDYVDDEKVYEFKFTTSPPDKPRPHDELQLKIYMWLTGKSKGELVYISPVGIKCFEVNHGVTDDGVRGLIRNRWAKWKWECYTCPFRHECKYRRW